MFKHRIVFFKQPACPACSAMSPIWVEASQEIAEEYPYTSIGFGEWDVTSDDWKFADSIGVDGTPNFAIFSEDSELIALNTEGMLSKTELKSFILENTKSV